MNKNCSEYLDNISVLFNIISRDKKTMFDEYIHGLGEFVREDDYDLYDLIIEVLMIPPKHLNILMLAIWKIWNDYVDGFKVKNREIEKKNL